MQFDSAFMFGDEDASTVALALTAVASTLSERETDSDRQVRKAKIVGLKLQLLSKLDRGVQETFTTPTQLFVALAGRVEVWPETKRDALLIEVAFASPFAPYDVQVTDKQHREALRVFAEGVGLSARRADEIMAAIASARRAHTHVEWGKLAAGIVIGSVVMAAGGYLAAPLIAAQLGAAAGLSGAAAVSHGLALLGGGSLALGGGGMAGGMALITTMGFGVGAVGVGGATALWNAGYAAAVTELVKLQVSYREILLRGHLREHVAAQVIEDLIAQRDELRRKIVEEKALNDSGAPRVKELERIERGYVDAIGWLKHETGE